MACSAMLVVLSIPLPDKEVAVGLLLALLVIVSGPAGKLAPQLLAGLKSPEAAIEVTGAAAVPLLVTVTACGALEDPVATEPKPSAVGLIEIRDPLSGR